MYLPLPPVLELKMCTTMPALTAQFKLQKPESYVLVTWSQHFMLKILLPFYYQRYRVHFQFPHIFEVIFSSSFHAQIFRHKSMNEISKGKCRIYIIVTSKPNVYFSGRHLYHTEDSLFLNSQTQFFLRNVNKIN